MGSEDYGKEKTESFRYEMFKGTLEISGMDQLKNRDVETEGTSCSEWT